MPGGTRPQLGNPWNTSPVIPLRHVATWIGLLAFYVAIACAFLWPLPTALDTHIWGDRFDAWTTLWLIDHLGDGLANGDLTSHTTEILFPFGYDLWSFGHVALQGIGGVMVAFGLPLVLSYNLLLVGGLATSGLAAHALGRTLSRDHLGGVVAGVTFCTTPYLYGEGAAGCIELVSAGFLPLFALTLVRVARAPGWRTAVPAALVLAITGPFNWYYTLFSGMMGLGIAAWQLAAGRRKAVAWMVLAMGAAALSNAPLIPMVRQETPTRPPISAELFEDPDTWTRVDEITNGTAPLDDLTMARAEEVDALQVFRNATKLGALLVAKFTVNPLESTPGRVAFAVGLFGLAAGRRQAWGWAGIAAGATILTLGPFLALDDRPPMDAWSGEVPLPYYYAYQYLPFFSKAYRPYRIGVITLTCLSAMGAVGVAAVRAEVGRRWVALGAAALTMLAVSQPLWSGDKPAHRPMADARIPDLYGSLAELPEGAVVEVPLLFQPTTIANARYQYNQTRHEHPVLNCNQLIRRDDLLAFRSYVETNGFLADLVDLGRSEPPYQFTGADLQALRDDGFRYVVVRRRVEADLLSLAGVSRGDLVVEPAMSMLPAVLGEPVLSDEDGDVYVLPDQVEESRVWTFDGSNVIDVDFPVDALRYMLSVELGEGVEVPVWSGGGRQVSFWARQRSGDPVVLVDGDRRIPLSIDPTHWTFQQVALESGSARLQSEGEASIEVTLVQVLQ